MRRVNIGLFTGAIEDQINILRASSSSFFSFTGFTSSLNVIDSGKCKFSWPSTSRNSRDQKAWRIDHRLRLIGDLIVFDERIAIFYQKNKPGGLINLKNDSPIKLTATAKHILLDPRVHANFLVIRTTSDSDKLRIAVINEICWQIDVENGAS